MQSHGKRHIERLAPAAADFRFRGASLELSLHGVRLLCSGRGQSPLLGERVVSTANATSSLPHWQPRGTVIPGKQPSRQSSTSDWESATAMGELVALIWRIDGATHRNRRTI